MPAETTPGPLTLEDLERLESVATAAARLHRGPWRVDDNGTDVLGAMGDVDDVILAEFGGKPFHSATPEFAAMFAALDPSTVLRLTAALRSVMAERDALRALCDRVREAWGDGIACSCFSFASSCGCNEPAVRAAIEALGPGGEK